MKEKFNFENTLNEIFMFHAKNIHEKYGLPVSIWRPDAGENKLIIAASAGLKTKYHKSASISLTGSSVTGDVYKNREMEVVKDIAADKRWKYKQDAKALGLKSAVCVPIIADGKSKGVLTIYITNNRRSDFKTFKNFLESTASQIGSSIEVEIRQVALKKLLLIGKKINSLPISKEYKPILETITKWTRSVLGADLVDLYVYNEEDDKIDLPPIQVGKRKSKPPTEIKKDDAVNELIRGASPLRKPIYIKDAVNRNTINNRINKNNNNYPKAQRFIEREGIVSTAIIPLVVLEEVVGILFVNYKVPQLFDNPQKELILSFANQASFAISNLNLSSKKRKRDKAINMFNAFAEDLGGLNEANENNTNSKLLSDRLLQKIADGARDVLEADLTNLYQYQQSLDTFPLPIIYSGNRFVSTKKNEVPKDDFVYSIIKAGRSRYIVEALTEPKLVEPHPLGAGKPVLRYVVREKIVSVAVVPMRIADEIVGVLFASYRTRQNFSDSQRKLLEQFAVQAATAIHAVRMLEKRQALVEFGNAITSRPNLDESKILKLVREKASDFMDTRNMYIALYDEEPKLVRFGLMYQGGERQDVAPRKFVEGKGNIGKTEEIIMTKTHIFHSTEKEATSWFKQPGHQSFVSPISPSWIGVPMLYDNKVVGVIATYSERENVYSWDDLATLQTIASQAAVALANARSYVKIDKLLKALTEFSEANSRQRLRELDILALIKKQVSDLMFSDSMYVALYDKEVETIRFGIAYESGSPKERSLRNLDKNMPSMVEDVILTKRPVLISSREDSVNWHKVFGHQLSVDMEPNASWLGVPLMLGEEVLGAIVVYHRDKEFVYGSDDVFFLERLSTLAAIALYDANQYYMIEQPLRALVEFGQQLTSRIKSSRKDLIVSIYEKAKNFLALDVENIFIATCTTDEKNVGIVQFDLVYRNGSLTKWTNRDAKIGRIGEIIRTKKPLLLATEKAINNWFEERREEKARVSETASWLGVPMIIENKVIGVIGVSHPSQQHHYNQYHLKNLQDLANYAAIAFENIRLLDEANAEIIAQKQLNTLGRAMAAIEHRINNTLNIIVPNINRLRKRVNAADPEIKEILEIIERNTKYTSILIDKIRTFSLDFDYADVNINATLEEIINKQKFDWAADSTHLMQMLPSFEADSAIPPVRLPIGQISEVFINLIQNAYKQLEKAYLKQHVEKVVQSGDLLVLNNWLPKLHVSTSLVHGKIKVIVKDNVPGGIPPKIAERLFLKPVPSQTPGEGSGLGLWLSKMIMDSIGGTINKTINTDSSGTTMVLEIPLQNSGEERK